MPQSNIHHAVYFNGDFWGAITSGTGGSDALGSRYGVFGKNVIELRRVAFASGHPFQTSQAVSIAMRLIKQVYNHVQLVISFADTNQGHYGGIYQAMGWWYLGQSNGCVWDIGGKKLHTRTVNDYVHDYNKKNFPFLSAGQYVKKFLDIRGKIKKMPPKHRYGLALDPKLNLILREFSTAYPKRLSLREARRPGTIL